MFVFGKPNRAGNSKILPSRLALATNVSWSVGSDANSFTPLPRLNGGASPLSPLAAQCRDAAKGLGRWSPKE